METTAALQICSIGVLFVLIFWGVSMLRRERLSSQFLLEGSILTAIAAAWAAASGPALHPIYFLILLYLLTMRARLLIELGNALARWGRPEQALTAYRLARRLLADRAVRLMAAINIGATYLTMEKFEPALRILEETKASLGRELGPKYVAGCRYNLGMAYRRCGRRREAVREFYSVAEIYPLSTYARLAEQARVATLKEIGAAAIPDPASHHS